MFIIEYMMTIRFFITVSVLIKTISQLFTCELWTIQLIINIIRLPWIYSLIYSDSELLVTKQLLLLTEMIGYMFVISYISENKYHNCCGDILFLTIAELWMFVIISLLFFVIGFYYLINLNNKIKPIKLQSCKYNKNIHQYDVCSICREEYDNHDLYQLGCNHIDHKQCLDMWFKNIGYISCPKCRWKST